MSPLSKEWVKECPQCHEIRRFKSRRGFRLSLKNNTRCRTCSGRDNMKKQDKSFFVDPDYKRRMSESLKLARKDETKYGESFREKCRKNRAIQLQRGIGGMVSYNPNACVFMDRLNEERGWNLIHALNGGEKMVEGFFLDGYDEQRKIAFEYDEPKHHTLAQQKRDSIKRNVIVKYLSPMEFWRYDEKNKTLYNSLEAK